MAKEEPSATAQTITDAAKATDTLSQFIARVLNQLSLSAWLPAAALVLLLTFVVQLATALDHREGARETPVAVAVKSIAEISLGGALLLFSAIVVLTMVTQAFAFEAIRVLEGYWGTNRLIEWIAQWLCCWHRWRRRRLDERLVRITDAAWYSAERTIDLHNKDIASRRMKIEMTPNVVAALRARVLDDPTPIKLTKAEQNVRDAMQWTWRRFASPDLIRRQTNIHKRLRDYPQPERILPTRLGNVLRHHEDKTGSADPESFVQRVYDDLPLSLKIEHDDQRSRLDLYCTMVFVIATVTSWAAVRFAVEHPWYALGAAIIGAAAMSLMYRAAVASARAYGGLLLVAARHANQRPAQLSIPSGGKGSHRTPQRPRSSGSMSRKG